MKRIKKFIPLTSDSAFKILFSEYDEFVKYFLETILETDVNDIKFLDREQVKEKINEHRMTLDLLLLINEYITLDIEVNRSLFNYVMEKSLFYAIKVFGSRIKEGEKYKKSFKFVQLNLNTRSNKNSLPEERITIRNNSLDRDVTDKFLMLAVDIEKYCDLYYNYGVREPKAKLYAMLGAKSLRKLENIARSALPEKAFEVFWRKYIYMCNDDEIISEYDRELAEQMVLRNELNGALEEGKAIGIEEKNISMVKKMLEKNYDINEISELTGLTIDKIKEIESQE